MTSMESIHHTHASLKRSGTNILDEIVHFSSLTGEGEGNTGKRFIG